VREGYPLLQEALESVGTAELRCESSHLYFHLGMCLHPHTNDALLLLVEVM
jgi:hypothetical protein